MKNGATRCVVEFKDDIQKIRKLNEYSFYEGGEDKGSSIRTKS